MNVVLVTGASGFIGRYAVCALMERGFTVHAVARQPLTHLPAVWHQIDLLDPMARRDLVKPLRPTHLLHLAWETRHGYFWEAPENLDWLAATLDLVRVFQSCGGLRAVFAGSCAEYDWSVANSVFHEHKTACRPTLLYGMAKLALHNLMSAHAARTGLSYAWGRIFFTYGPFEPETKLVPYVVSSLLAGQPAKLGNASTVRDFLHVREVGFALSALLDSATEGPVNIGSGEAITIAEVARRVATLMGREGSLLEFRPPPTPANEPMRVVADIMRLRDEVGYSPSRDLNAGLADAVAWWQSEMMDR